MVAETVLQKREDLLADRIRATRRGENLAEIEARDPVCDFIRRRGDLPQLLVTELLVSGTIAQQRGGPPRDFSVELPHG